MARTQTSPTDAHKPKAVKKSSAVKAKAPAAKKAATKAWTAFLLTNKQMSIVKGVKKAKLYEEENGEMIDDKMDFVLKSEAADWCKMREMQFKELEPEVSDGKSEPSNPTLNPDDQTKLDMVLKDIDAKRPSDRIEIYFKTTTKSQAVSIIIRFYNIQGRDVWNIKPDGASLALSNFGKVFKQEDKTVEQAILNLTYGRMRDLAGDPNKVATKTWTSPTNQSERTFDTCVMMTHFILPDLEELPTLEAENMFIEKTCTALGNAILYILKQDTFAKCYQHAIKNERVWSAVTGQSGKGEGKSYTDFAKTAKVVLTLCKNFNTHVVKSDAAKLCTILYDNNYNDAKYPEPELSDSEDDDDKEGEAENEPKTPPVNRKLVDQMPPDQDDPASNLTAEEIADLPQQELDRADDDGEPS